MICKSCGAVCSNDSKFCPNCGAEIKKEDRVVDAEVVGEKKPGKVWKVFAKIGWILGIVSVAACWVPYFVIYGVGIPGIVLSCLGKKADDAESAVNSKKGLKLSIIGTAVNLVITIIVIVLITVLSLAAAEEAGGILYEM